MGFHYGDMSDEEFNDMMEGIEKFEWSIKMGFPLLLALMGQGRESRHNPNYRATNEAVCVSRDDYAMMKEDRVRQGYESTNVHDALGKSYKVVPLNLPTVLNMPVGKPWSVCHVPTGSMIDFSVTKEEADIVMLKCRANNPEHREDYEVIYWGMSKFDVDTYVTERGLSHD